METARLRVEGLIQDDIYVELLEVLEVSPEPTRANMGTGGDQACPVESGSRSD